MFHLDRDVADVIQTFQEAKSAHQEFLRSEHEELASGVLVVLLDRLHQIVEGEAVTQEGIGVDAYLVLQNVTTDRQDIRHPPNRLQLELDDPVVEFAQVGVRILAFGVDILIQFKVVDEDLPESRRNGAEDRRLLHLRQFRDGHREPLRNELTGKVDADVVPEVDVDHRHAEGGGRFDLGHAGKPVHGGLDGIGDEPLDLLRSHTMALGKHGNHYRGDVGKGVDGHPVVFVGSVPDHRDDHHDDQAFGPE